MKTSIEMQIKILEHAIENIKNGRRVDDRVFFKDKHNDATYPCQSYSFEDWEYSIKPETITLKNGVEIPKPLSKQDILIISNGSEDHCFYTPALLDEGFGYGASEFELDTVLHCIDMHNKSFFYASSEEAIQASKALFGIE